MVFYHHPFRLELLGVSNTICPYAKLVVGFQDAYYIFLNLTCTNWQN
jgi:hypothetical protein